MKSFREYMQEKLNEAVQGAPVLEFQNVQFSFPFGEDIYEPGYNPMQDRGERSDSGVMGTEENSSTFNGTVTVPLTDKAVMNVKMANNGNIGKESIMSFVVENGTETLDLLDADFAGSFRPNIDDLESYPDSLYRELARELADKIENGNFEVKNV
jgi:hypothetical protein